MLPKFCLIHVTSCNFSYDTIAGGIRSFSVSGTAGHILTGRMPSLVSHCNNKRNHSGCCSAMPPSGTPGSPLTDRTPPDVSGTNFLTAKSWSGFAGPHSQPAVHLLIEVAPSDCDDSPPCLQSRLCVVHIPMPRPGPSIPSSLVFHTTIGPSVLAALRMVRILTVLALQVRA